MPKKQETQLTQKQSQPGWRSANRVKCWICSSWNSIRDCSPVDLQGSPIQGWYCNRCLAGDDKDAEDGNTYIDDKKDKKGSGHKKDKTEKKGKQDKNPTKKTTTTKKTGKTGRTSSQ